jgi:hypothetical protein
MRHTRTPVLVALASCLGASACGSLLGIGDLPTLDGGAGSILDGEAIVAESGSARAGADSAVPGSEAGPAEAGDVGLSTDAQAEAGNDAAPPDAAMADVEAPDAAMGVCAPTATQCVGNDSVETCGPSGQWESAVACTDSACVSGSCTGVCSPGATQCSGSSVETCSESGTWGGPVACPYMCSGGTCVCDPGTVQCSGNGVQTCGSDGQWGAVSSCPSPATGCVGAGICICECSGATAGTACASADCNYVYPGYICELSGMQDPPAYCAQ